MQAFHHMINFLQRTMYLFVLNIKMLKKTKRYLSCTNFKQKQKQKLNLKQKHIQLPEFSREIKLSFYLDQLTATQIQQQPSPNTTNNPIVQDTAIFQLLIIKINNNRYSIFFERECGDFVSRYNAIRSLTSNATQEHPGPITIGGVGGVISVSQHGIYKDNLPLYNGIQATMSGVCLDNITSKCPLYPQQGKVLNDIIKAYKDVGGDARTVPKIPKSVGGEINFMSGTKCFRYYFQLPSGLTIYESVFENAHGGRDVKRGPHKIFNNIRNSDAEDNIHITFFSN